MVKIKIISLMPAIKSRFGDNVQIGNVVKADRATAIALCRGGQAEPVNFEIESTIMGPPERAIFKRPKERMIGPIK